MTSDEIRNYRGPVFRATVKMFSRHVTHERPEYTDLNSTSMENLNASIASINRNDWAIASITYGPHTADYQRQVIEDAHPMPKIGI